MTTRTLSLLWLALSAALCAGAARAARPHNPAAMVAAARAFLDSLTPELRAKASLPFDGPERTDWHYVPRPRPGATFAHMSDPQRLAAHGLLRAALSSRGYLKVTSIMELETVLREVESSPSRDPENYALAVYGEPGGDKPWGWKFEGHHVCLNFSSVTREVTAVTPSFLGANPAEVRRGRHAGLRVLAAEEDLGRELVKSLDGTQRAGAIISAAAPADIILSPGRAIDQAAPAGLAWTHLNDSQRAVLWRLVREYAENLHDDLSGEEIRRIEKAGVEKITFAWAGGLEPGTGHYYRIQGPTFVIEYDNTQNDANHVHTVWHDTQRDFWRDLLGEHYRRGGHDGADTSPAPK